MIEIRQILHPYLLTLHPRAWFDRAPNNAQYPYLVYTFSVIQDDGQGYQQMTLDVDGWDDREDTTRLEVLMSTVEAGLDKHGLVGTGVVLRFYIENKNSIPEDDGIQRRRYMFQGRVFKRS